VAWLALDAAAGCAGRAAAPEPAPAATAVAPGASGSALRAAPAPHAAAGVDAATDSAAAAAPAASASPPIRFRDWPGSRVVAGFEGARAWTLVPASGDTWDVCKLVILPYLRSEGFEQVFRLDDREIWVPGALVRVVAPPGRLARGTPLRVHLSESHDAPYARIVEAGAELRIRVALPGGAEERRVPAEHALELRGSFELGEPVAYEVAGDFHRASVAHRDEEQSWIVVARGETLDEVPTASLRALDFEKPHAPGARVWALADAAGGPAASRLEPAQVIEPIDEGLYYRVRFDGGGEALRVFADVTKPLRVLR
jgi:hypothetical protein